jgi:uncharacterized protein YecT (DUF1311 family)
MQVRIYAALLLAVPTVVFAECDIPETALEVAYVSVWEAANPMQQGLLESAQRAWYQCREANCELMSEREDLKADALATCLHFMDREREFELRLISRFVRRD